MKQSALSGHCLGYKQCTLKIAKNINRIASNFGDLRLMSSAEVSQMSFLKINRNREDTTLIDG